MSCIRIYSRLGASGGVASVFHGWGCVMCSTMLPWDMAEPWPKFGERISSEWLKSFEIPEWASRLAGLGHWMVTSGANGRFHRSVVIVPIRNTAAIWVALGALMAGLASSKVQSIKTGQTVWFPPLPRKTKFGEGKVGSPAQDEDGRFRIERSRGRNNSWTEFCDRHGFFAVENPPSLEAARSAEKAAFVARQLGIQCGPDPCLMLEDAVQIAGGKEQVQFAASQIELGGVTLAQLMMLEDGGRFSMCRALGGRRAKPDDKARLVIMDGPGGLGILEDESFKAADTPAVAILTPDEWFSAQPDSDRIANALGDWRGEYCAQWPRELEMPGLGCLLYRKDSSQ